MVRAWSNEEPTASLFLWQRLDYHICTIGPGDPSLMRVRRETLGTWEGTGQTTLDVVLQKVRTFLRLSCTTAPADCGGWYGALPPSRLPNSSMLFSLSNTHVLTNSPAHTPWLTPSHTHVWSLSPSLSLSLSLSHSVQRNRLHTNARVVDVLVANDVPPSVSQSVGSGTCREYIFTIWTPRHLSAAEQPRPLKAPCLVLQLFNQAGRKDRKIETRWTKKFCDSINASTNRLQRQSSYFVSSQTIGIRVRARGECRVFVSECLLIFCSFYPTLLRCAPETNERTNDWW